MLLEEDFPFCVLLMTGSGTKSLMKPSLSSSFKWTPKEVAGRADSCVYILAEKKLKNEVLNNCDIGAIFFLHDPYKNRCIYI